jgi:asparagine synthase (glutamine-hydrolysing)
MCGFAGIYHFSSAPVDPARIERLRSALAHRGPDASASLNLGPCTLLHTRLAVLDLPGGQQPMVLTDHSDHPTPPQLAVVFNGEIYNHRDLRRRLQAAGHRFTSDHSDTEVLLHGYRQWGVNLPEHLQGMFAFAIFDPLQRQLFLARDRTGKKPLFIRHAAGQLLFASTIAALIAAGPEAPPIDRAALHQFLTFGYTRESSLWQGIEELPAASWRLIKPDGSFQHRRYWQPPPISRSGTSVDAGEALLRLLDEAVASRLEADVPLGCFLSGGIDSSLIAALAQRHLARQGRRLATFTVAMPDVRYDESPFAQQVASHIGSDHHVLTARPDLEADLRTLISQMGEPLGDSSLLPTHWLSRAARQHVTVALSGDGGDELFAGYDRYRALTLLTSHRWWLRYAPAGLLATDDPKSTMSRVRRLIEAAQEPTVSRQYRSMVRLFTAPQLTAMGFGPDDTGELFDWDGRTHPVDAARRWDLHNYLPFDLLRKVDRASMSVGLEVRCPMLDTGVYDLAAHVPLHVLMPGQKPKGLLRNVAAQLLPPQIINRRKMGFAVPIGSWFAGPLAPMLRHNLLDDPALDQLGIHAAAVRSILDEHLTGQADHAQRIFALLSLALWQQWRRTITP